jgi:hypothetical protein
MTMGLLLPFEVHPAPPIAERESRSEPPEDGLLSPEKRNRAATLPRDAIQVSNFDEPSGEKVALGNGSVVRIERVGVPRIVRR